MAKGKEQKGGALVKNVQAFERLSFLHQAATLMSTLKYDAPAAATSAHNVIKPVKNWKGDPPGTLHATSRYLNSHMKQITGKLVMRLDPSVKRAICKRCDTPVIPAITSINRIISKPVPNLTQICKICRSKRSYTTQNSNYQLFNNRPDVIEQQNEQDLPPTKCGP